VLLGVVLPVFPTLTSNAPLLLLKKKLEIVLMLFVGAVLGPLDLSAYSFMHMPLGLPVLLHHHIHCLVRVSILVN